MNPCKSSRPEDEQRTALEGHLEAVRAAIKWAGEQGFHEARHELGWGLARLEVDSAHILQESTPEQQVQFVAKP